MRGVCRTTFFADGKSRRTVGMDVCSRWLGLLAVLGLLCAALAGPVSQQTNRQRKIHLLQRVIDDIREILVLLQEEDYQHESLDVAYQSPYMSTSHSMPAKREPPSGFAAVLGKRSQEMPHRRYAPFGRARNGYKRDPPSGFVSVLGKRNGKYDFLMDGGEGGDRENIPIGEYSGDSSAGGKEAFWNALAKVGKRSADKPSANRNQS